jgi:hypothetical protein
MPVVRPIDTRPAELGQFVRDWSDGMLDRTALTDADRIAVTDAIRRCYEAAGLPWPGRLVWAPSPLAGRLLAADLARRHTPVTTRIRAAASLAGDAIRPTLRGALAYGCNAALVCAAVAAVLLFMLPDAAAGSPDPTFPPEHWRGMWIGGVVGGLLMAPVCAWLLAAGIPSGLARGVGYGVFVGAVMVVFGQVPTAAVAGSFAGLGVSALAGGSSPPPEPWVTTLLTSTLVPTVAVVAVGGMVFTLLTDRPGPLRCPDPAHDRLDRRLTAALTAALAAAPAGSAAPAQVRRSVDASTAGIDRCLDLAVQWAARARRRWLDRYPVGHVDGQYGGRLAAATWLTASGAPVPADAAALVRDFAAASRAGWWWPHTRFVVVSERPCALHLERVGVGDRAPAGGQRLHRTDGPAAEWPDGYAVYALHGTGVPADLVEDGWGVEAIHRHPNSEVRRAAIELVGWADYIRRAGWRLVATAPDPGNPPHELLLYEDPSRRLRDVRVLVMTNGSPDRSGETRRHAETVPDTIDDPVVAAAWQYGCPVEVYRQLRRRT